MDEPITQFISITDASPDKARQYLNVADNNVEQAIELFYNTGGVDLIETTQPQASTSIASQAPPVPAAHTRPERSRDNIIDLDSDDEMEMEDETASISSGTTGAVNATASSTHESDEAMARRLQDELYGHSGMMGAGTGIGDVDEDGYRAPIARTRETLVGPEPYDLNDTDRMRAAVMENLRSRGTLREQMQRASRPGIFNQQSSIWSDEAGSSGRNPRAALSRATGGASESSSKSTVLAEMYRPPFELMSNLSWDEARDEGKALQKWILVNVQDPSIFDCQVVNRDLWKHEGVRETIRENFIFIQCNKDDARGNQYMQYYFQNHDDEQSYPHIAIVDPRTGEQVKVWSGPPVPKASEFLMQLHEFLDRYSLSVTAKNPVAKRKPEQKKKKGVESMTEDEQLQMAMQASLAGQDGMAQGDNMENDPDALTRSVDDTSKLPTSVDLTDDGVGPSTHGENGITASVPNELEPTIEFSPFEAISSSNPQTEPAATEPNTTRIQFRHPTGRVVRRFALADPVRRLYEWLKAEPLEGKAGIAFELVAMGKNLIESLEQTVEEAGLRNGTVMIEFVASEGDDDREA